MAEWELVDRPKWYRALVQQENSKYDLEMLTTLSLPQIIALEHHREEMSFAKAIKTIKDRKKKNV